MPIIIPPPMTALGQYNFGQWIRTGNPLRGILQKFLLTDNNSSEARNDFSSPTDNLSFGNHNRMNLKASTNMLKKTVQTEKAPTFNEINNMNVLHTLSRDGLDYTGGIFVLFFDLLCTPCHMSNIYNNPCFLSTQRITFQK